MLRRTVVAPVVAVLLFALGCAPVYDDVADKMLVDVQKQVDEGLIKLETQAVRIETPSMVSDAASRKALEEAKAKANYAANTDWYDNVTVALIALDSRMTAMPDQSTANMTGALAKLQQNFAALRAKHAQDGVLSATVARNSRRSLDQEFGALTVYVLTLKNGKKPQ